MGVTLRSKNYSIDLGYFGFFRLRRKVAALISEEVGAHYAALELAHSFDDPEQAEEWWDRYDTETACLISKTPKNIRKVFAFLYESDCDGAVSYGVCKQILTVVSDYDDDILYGYAGRPDCARFRDFKKLMRDCVDNKCKLKWW